MKNPRTSTSHKTHPIQDLSSGEHDAYRAKQKLSDGTCCPDCGAVFTDSRWQWSSARDDAPRERCPACRRIHDNFPAGYVHLAGAYVVEHRAEISAIVRNLESKEKAEHPLQRVMNIEEDSGGMRITTTDVHLARAMGEALHHAHGGKLEIKYGPDDNVVRVAWNR
jgi:NMD protein affecting ribosome stability and mRNA decay